MFGTGSSHATAPQLSHATATAPQLSHHLQTIHPNLAASLALSLDLHELVQHPEIHGTSYVIDFRKLMNHLVIVQMLAGLKVSSFQSSLKDLSQ